jgi:ABC-type amino acid transport substrate-binding protein
MDGEMSAIIARTDFPKARTYSLPQLSDISQLLLSVATGKADVAFVDPVEAYHFIKHNPGSLENITPDQPVRVFGDTYMFCRGETEFKDMLNTTLDELANSGEIDQVIQKYEPYPNAYIRVALPYRQSHR